VSLIHKALRQADQTSSSSNQTAYNPLTPKSTKKPSASPYTIAGVVFFCAALGVLFWPKKLSENSPVTTANNEAVIPSTEAKNSESLSATIPAIETPVETPDELQEPTPVIVIAKNEETVESPSQANEPKIETPTDVEKSQIEPSADSNSTIKNNSENKQTSVIASAPVKPTEAKPKETVEPSPSIEVKQTGSSVTESSNSTKVTEQKPINSIVSNSKFYWKEQVEQHIKSGEIEKAEAVLKQWIGASPNDSAPRIWLARIYINNGFYQAAEPLLRNLTSTDAKGLLGIVYERTNRPAYAASLFEELYRANPENGRWLLFWALNAENSGQLAKSSTLYQNYLNVFSFEDAKLTGFAEKRLRVIGGK